MKKIILQMDGKDFISGAVSPMGFGDHPTLAVNDLFCHEQMDRLKAEEEARTAERLAEISPKKRGAQ